jgi:hypothetical protein
VSCKDLSPVEHFKNHPKCFLFGLNSENSTNAETLMLNYLSFVKEKEIKFPLLSFCGLLNGSFFLDHLNTENADSAENPCDVFLNQTKENTLLSFLLNLASLIDQDPTIKKPDYRLYVNSYKKFVNKKRLSDGWFFH